MGELEALGLLADRDLLLELEVIYLDGTAKERQRQAYKSKLTKKRR